MAIEVPDKFGDLYNILELDRFVEYYGDLYCVAESCDGCEFKDNGCEFVEAPLEVTITPATRRIIGTGQVTKEPAEREIEEKDLVNYENRNRLWHKKSEPKTGYLTNSGKRFYKKIVNLEEDYENGELEFVLYRPEDGEYYCIKQDCKNCDLRDSCEIEIVEGVTDRDVLITLDLSAQEPRLFSLLSNEVQWLKVFKNDSLYKDPELMKYWDYLFKNEFQVDIENNKVYWKYLDHKFWVDKSELLEFNVRVLEYRQDSSEENLKLLNDMIDKIKEDWLNYVQKQTKK